MDFSSTDPKGGEKETLKIDEAAQEFAERFV